ncbi:MAG: hypothetical protein JF588_13200 [Caulobacterales bacterium]|nr:hypothetical protein [Caulobacterales bacterium]
MPRFHFHLATPAGLERDEIGSDCASAEVAYLDARQAAMEISHDSVRQGGDPAGYRFEICDAKGRLIQVLPFAEILAPPARPTPHGQDVLRSRVLASLSRSRQLQAELTAGFEEARTSLARTFALLR